MSAEPRTEPAGGPFSGYAPPEKRPPFAPYAAFAATFNGALIAFVAAGRRGRFDFPERIGAGDLLLIAGASHKLSRVIAKERITSFLRAPFKRYEGPGGPSELSERTRGTGLRAAIGELIGCPWCLGLWLTGPLTAALVVAPRETRFVATIFSSLAVSDFLNVAYRAAERKGLGG